MKRVVAVTLACTLAAPLHAQRVPTTRDELPVLSLPDPRLDDTTAYEGYRTRFYRDSKGNTLQIYLRRNEGRVVNLWADAANESISFTARDSAGSPASLTWTTEIALTADSGTMRVVSYHLTSGTTHLRLGWFLLGTMRIERDFQYWRKHLDPYTAPPFHIAELDSLVRRMASLPATERRVELALLHARTLGELRGRLEPTVTIVHAGSREIVRVVQPSFDARHAMSLEIGVDSTRAQTKLVGRAVFIDSRSDAPIDLTIRVATNSAPLTPLTRAEIFDRAFLAFADSASRKDPRVERQLRAVELLSSREKLMAGLPNFATYFGRDQMMSALMMQSVWTPSMMEHVIGSVLRKLAPNGEVSHEEALGGQAIREAAGDYVRLIDSARALGRTSPRDTAVLMGRARVVLGSVERVRENYHMIDDEFQLPVLVARYLSDHRLAADAKRAFLNGHENGQSRLALLVKELEVVASRAAPYAARQDATNLVGFAARDATHWESESWRDSGAGYANGRFAMDINAIWVPMALDAIGEIIDSVHAIGLGVSGTTLGPNLSRYIADRSALQAAERAWGGAVRHFIVRLAPAEIDARVNAKLASLPANEQRYWHGVFAASGASRDSISFLALSLDAAGNPIPVMNTDPATALFLLDLSGRTFTPMSVEPFRNLDPFIRQYPVGLFVEGLGPLVANDAYASPEVWNTFEHDQYHSPRVVWGREVNLITLGLAHQLAAAVDAQGRPRDPSLAPYVARLASTLRHTQAAVTASGLRQFELWSYRIDNDRLQPVRYGTSSDVQLWNTTALAVQWALSRLPRAVMR
ncbi:MAG: hypothetical protein ACJ796_03140 [Gemmatimonadaceae bacterium]